MTAVWLSIADVARRVDMSDDIVRERMHETPAHIEKPWINVSTAKRPEWRFTNEAEIDRWWKEVHLWRASESATASGKSDGANPPSTATVAGTSPSAATPAAGKKTRSRSSPPSPTAKSAASPIDPSRPNASLALLPRSSTA